MDGACLCQIRRKIINAVAVPVVVDAESHLERFRDDRIRLVVHNRTTRVERSRAKTSRLGREHDALTSTGPVLSKSFDFLDCSVIVPVGMAEC